MANEDTQNNTAKSIPFFKKGDSSSGTTADPQLQQKRREFLLKRQEELLLRKQELASRKQELLSQLNKLNSMSSESNNILASPLESNPTPSSSQVSLRKI